MNVHLRQISSVSTAHAFYHWFMAAPLHILGIIVIAILGSAVPSYVIAKVRPAEVLRGE